MTHSKTIKRPDGWQYRIEVRYRPADNRDPQQYIVMVTKAAPGKRKFSLVDCSNELTPAEIHAAKMELWEKMKPEL